MSPAAAREPERVLAAAGRVDVRVEVVGHRADVLVADVVPQLETEVSQLRLDVKTTTRVAAVTSSDEEAARASSTVRSAVRSACCCSRRPS